MMRVKIILFALVLVLFGCGHRTAVILDDVETYIQERPDSALATLRAIDTTTLTTKKLQAHYALLHAMALDKNWIDTTDVNVVMPAVRYYDRHPSGDRRAKAWYYLGRIQQNGMDYPAASISLLKAERYAENASDNDFRSLVYLSISTVYGQTHLHEEALDYAERAYKLFLQACDTINANAALFTMAQDLNNVGRYEESDSLYRLLIEKKEVHPNLNNSMKCGYGLLLVSYREDFEKAVSIFEEVIESGGSLKQMNYWGAYAYALARTGNQTKSDQLFRQIESKSRPNTLSYPYWKSKADAYAGDYASAYRHQKNASEIQEWNVKSVLKQSVIKAQKEFLEEMNLESERTARRQRLIGGIAIAGLMVIIFLLALFFKHRSNRSAQERESLLEAYDALTSQAEEEKAMVRNQYIHLCQSYFSHFGGINEVLYKAKDTDNKLFKDLKQALQDVGMDNKNAGEFEKLLDESFDNVMTHFREAFPKRKPRFYQLVGFLFAGFATSTICIIIPEYKKENIHVERFRLKKMIRESDSPYKEQFLNLLS